jgi:two-component system NtrC family sensor kinase
MKTDLQTNKENPVALAGQRRPGHCTHSVITLRTGRDGGNAGKGDWGWGWIEVQDTGASIEPAHLKRIFEPFFTTKPVGQGAGLGPPLFYGFVQKYGGRIEGSREPGKGTRFRVCLPLDRRAPDGGNKAVFENKNV